MGGKAVDVRRLVCDAFRERAGQSPGSLLVGSCLALNRVDRFVRMVVHPHCLSLVLQTLEVSVRAWAITLGMMLTLMLADRGSAELVPDLDPGSHEAVSLLPSLSDRASERRVDAIPEPTSSSDDDADGAVDGDDDGGGADFAMIAAFVVLGVLTLRAAYTFVHVVRERR